MRSLSLVSLLCGTTLLFGGEVKASDSEIATAMTAAPAEVSGAATVVNADGKVLREGSNGYTCWSSASFLGGYPTCLDEGLTNFINALLAGDEAPPASQTVAIGYMLQGTPAMSDDDPGSSLEQARAEGQEIFDGEPHITLLMPDRAALAALPTSPDAGGPWVMWSDTPYAHVMVPAPAPN